MLRFLLPSAIDLAKVAAHCTRGVVLWVADRDLVIRASAGQLLPLADPLEGQSIRVIRPPGHPAVLAAERALLGEVVPYVSEWYGKRWSCVVAPLYVARRVIGVTGNATLQLHERPVEREAPSVFQCVRGSSDVDEGDIVTVWPRGAQGIRLHRALSQRRFDVHLATGALIPVPHDAAYATDERQAAQASGRDVPPPRAHLRLLQG